MSLKSVGVLLATSSLNESTKQVVQKLKKINLCLGNERQCKFNMMMDNHLDAVMEGSQENSKAC